MKPIHVVTTTFQHMLWPKLRWVLLGNYPILSSFPLIFEEIVFNLECHAVSSGKWLLKILRNSSSWFTAKNAIALFYDTYLLFTS